MCISLNFDVIISSIEEEGKEKETFLNQTVLQTNTSLLQEWLFYPSRQLTTIDLSIRPSIALSYEMMILYFIMLQFNRNTRDYLWFRPLLGMIATTILSLDMVSFIAGVEYFEMYNTIMNTAGSGEAYNSLLLTTIFFIMLLLFNNLLTFICAAHVTLGHDRTFDGDTDGTDRFGETSGKGASGTGISSYRQEQLVYVRSALWSGAPLPPQTPIPLRVYLMMITGLFSCITSTFVFINQSLPIIYYFPSNDDVVNHRTAIPFLGSIPATELYWDDPLLILIASSMFGIIFTLTLLNKEIKRFLQIVQDLRIGKIQFYSNKKNDTTADKDNNTNVDIMNDVLPGIFSSGLLGWNIGFHFGSQLILSFTICILYKMISLLVKEYQHLNILLHLPFMRILINIFIISSICFMILYAIERYLIGTHRCLRPRHLNSCIEMLGYVLHSMVSVTFGMLYIIYLVFTINMIIGPLIHDLSKFIEIILHKSAERYEKNNNPTLRLSAALMRKINTNKKGSSSSSFTWDKEYIQAEQSLSNQEKMINRELRIFFFF